MVGKGRSIGRMALGLLVTLLVAFGLAPGLVVREALAEYPVPYMDWDGQRLVEKSGDDACKEYVEVDQDNIETTQFEDGMWYVVRGEVTVKEMPVIVHGDAHLIICDGAKLIAKKAVVVFSIEEIVSSLTIHGQSAGTGELIATGGEWAAGIGGEGGSGGSVTINGVNVTATGGENGAGIGGGGYGMLKGVVTVNAGTVRATGGSGRVGIGDNGTLTVAKTHVVCSSESEITDVFADGVDMVQGTGAAVDIARRRYMLIEPTPPHEHAFDYVASGATIAAECTGFGECDITDGLRLTVVAPEDLTYDGKVKTATIADGHSTVAFPADIDIAYERDGRPVDAKDVVEPGHYVAKVTVGEATASVDFSIAERGEEPPATYKVTVAQAEGGTVSVDKSEAAKDELVAVMATPADGYELVAVTVDGEQVDGASFSMPAKDVIVSARFGKKATPEPMPGKKATPEPMPGKKETPEPMPGKKETPEPMPGTVTLTGSGHVQGIGYVPATATVSGLFIGTTGDARRLEAFSLALSEGADGSVSYRSHLQSTGWSEWVADGQPCGTTGQSRRLEAIQVTLGGAVAEGNSVWYRVHSQNFGWLGWAKDGEAAGTAGQALRGEAIEVAVLPHGKTPSDYESQKAAYVGAAVGEVHVRDSGWVEGSGLRFGTEGQSRRIEAIRLSVPNLPCEGSIETIAHVRDLGWMGSAGDGQVAGTTGQSRRLEAVRIKLAGDASTHYSVYYRVHCQRLGWLGWAHDGETAGTTGLSLRAEAIEVQLLPKGAVPSDVDSRPAAVLGT